MHEDLQPFVCTFKACSEPKSFKRKADWVRHENERHRQLEWWSCSEEDCQHKCFRRDNFVQHLVREHRMQEPESVDRLLKTPVRESTKDRPNFNDGENNGSPSKVSSMLMTCRHKTASKPSDEPCSFCGIICKTWKKLTVHLARHMEQISMPVLDLVRQAYVGPATIISPIIATIRHPTSPVDELALSNDDVSLFGPAADAAWYTYPDSRLPSLNPYLPSSSTNLNPVIYQEEPLFPQYSDLSMGNPSSLNLKPLKPEPMNVYNQRNKEYAVGRSNVRR